MGKDPIVANHAFKHGLSKEDILHAWRNAYISRQRIGGRAFERISVGPDCSGRDVQVIFAWDRSRGNWTIFHAMPLTKGVKRELEI